MEEKAIMKSEWDVTSSKYGAITHYQCYRLIDENGDKNDNRNREYDNSLYTKRKDAEMKCMELNKENI